MHNVDTQSINFGLFFLLSFSLFPLSLLATSIIIISFGCLSSLLTKWCLLIPRLTCTLGQCILGGTLAFSRF